MFYNTDFLKDDEIFLSLEKTVEADLERNWLPAYHFYICDKQGTKVGKCDLRIGYNENVYYGGNIGYEIDEEYRGHHFAGKACILLFELARKHHMDYLIITCNPNNYASRKTCEFAGGILKEIVELPEDNDMRLEGETHECIYRFDFNNSIKSMSLNEYRDEVKQFLIKMGSLNGNNDEKIIWLKEEFELLQRAVSGSKIDEVKHQLYDILYLIFEMAADNNLDLDKEWIKGRIRKEEKYLKL